METEMVLVVAKEQGLPILAKLLGLMAFIVVPAVLIKRYLVPRVPRDCPYCGSSDMLRARYLAADLRTAIGEAVERILGLSLEVGDWWACRACRRVADPDVAIDEDPDVIWVQVHSLEKHHNPGEVEMFPPVPCRSCGECLVITGGPPEHRTCPQCNKRHNWWRDERSDLQLFLTMSEEATAADDARLAEERDRPPPPKGVWA